MRKARSTRAGRSSAGRSARNAARAGSCDDEASTRMRSPSSADPGRRLRSASAVTGMELIGRMTVGLHGPNGAGVPVTSSVSRPRSSRRRIRTMAAAFDRVAEVACPAPVASRLDRRRAAGAIVLRLSPALTGCRRGTASGGRSATAPARSPPGTGPTTDDRRRHAPDRHSSAPGTSARDRRAAAAASPTVRRGAPTSRRHELGASPPRRAPARPGPRPRPRPSPPTRASRGERRPPALPRGRPDRTSRGWRELWGLDNTGQDIFGGAAGHRRHARRRHRCGRQALGITTGDREHGRRGHRRRRRLQPSGPGRTGLDEPGRIGRRQGDQRDRRRRQRLHRRRPRLGLLPRRQHRPRLRRRLPRHARRRHDRGVARRRRASSGSPRASRSWPSSSSATTTPAATTRMAIAAIAYAKSFGVQIANASWGADGRPQRFARPVRRDPDLGDALRGRGRQRAAPTTTTARSTTLPASFDLPEHRVRRRPSTTRAGSTWFSNYGRRTVDIAAPGEAILSSPAGRRGPSGSGLGLARRHVDGGAARDRHRRARRLLRPGAWPATRSRSRPGSWAAPSRTPRPPGRPSRGGSWTSTAPLDRVPPTAQPHRLRVPGRLGQMGTTTCRRARACGRPPATT